MDDHAILSSIKIADCEWRIHRKSMAVRMYD